MTIHSIRIIITKCIKIILSSQKSKITRLNKNDDFYCRNLHFFSNLFYFPLSFFSIFYTNLFFPSKSSFITIL